MVRITIYLILTTLLISCKSTKSNQQQSPLTSNSLSTTSSTFPDDWMGYWAGNLKIYNHKGLSNEIPMAIDHALTDSAGVYTWALIYGEDIVAGRRDYLLRTVDAEKGHYVMDEKNSIFLDTYHIGNQMISTFEVDGTMITSIYKLEGETMHFKIIAGKLETIRKSGGKKQKDEEIPFVNSFPINAIQEGTLVKIK